MLLWQSENAYETCLPFNEKGGCRKVSNPIKKELVCCQKLINTSNAVAYIVTGNCSK